MIWLASAATLMVEVVISSLVPDPPVPEVGIGRARSPDETGPMTGWVTSVMTNAGIGDSIGSPASSSGVTR